MPRSFAAKKRSSHTKSDNIGDSTVAILPGKYKKDPSLVESDQTKDLGTITMPVSNRSGAQSPSPNSIIDEMSGAVTKRKRSSSTSSNPAWTQDASSPTVPIKKTRGAEKKKKPETAVGADKKELSDAEVEETGDDKTKATSKKEKAVQAPTEGPRKWKKDWKNWISAPENRTTEQFQRTYDEGLINVKESSRIYGMKSEDLACLPHCPVPNPHGKGFIPMKLFRKSDVIRLAFRKEAVLAGVSFVNDEELLERGQEMYEGKNGPVDQLYVEKMGDEEPAMFR